MIENIVRLLRSSKNNTSSNSTILDQISNLSENLQIGMVVDVFPYIGAFLVQFAGQPQLQCVDLQSQVSILGVRGFSTYPVGSYVLVYVPETSWGIILGAIPYNSQNSTISSEVISHGSKVGFIEDLAYNFPISLKDSGGIYDFSSGRPVDVLPGDWGYINHFGVSIGISALAGYIKASELSKLEFSALDNYVRLTAYNLDIFTAGSEKHNIEDRGEWSSIYQSSPYSWEALSATSLEEEIFNENTEELKSGEQKGAIEPSHEDQVGLWRHLILEGYLGSLNREYVLIPPSSGPDYLSRSLSERNYQAVLEIQKNIDGAYAVRSAKSILLEKTIKIPAPIQLAIPENPLGDDEDYDGLFVTNQELQLPDSPILKAMFSDEESSYLNNWFYLHQLKQHSKDWHLDEESQIYPSLKSNLGVLGEKYAFDAPTSTEIQVDQKTKEKYFAATSRAKMTEDGGLILEDAYGSQIILTGGNIYFTCPGSMFFQPGKSFVSMAGQDIILKARKDADLTTTLGDIRIKSEENLHLLGGNNGSKGGVVIESRTSGEFSTDGVGSEIKTTGVVIKSAGATNITGSSLYLGGKQKVVVESDDTISTKSAIFWRRLSYKATDEFVSSTLDNTKFNVYTANLSLFDSGMQIGGSVRLYNSSQLHINGDIVARSLNAQSAIRLVDSDQVMAVKELTIEPYETDEAYRDQEFELLKNDINSYNEDAEEKNYSPEKLQTLGVTLRTSDQYGLGEDFIIPESRWQRRYRVNGQNAQVWQESPVTSPAGKEETYPFPGTDIWNSQDRFKTVVPKFYNITNECSEDLPDREAVNSLGVSLEVGSECLNEKYTVSI